MVRLTLFLPLLAAWGAAATSAAAGRGTASTRRTVKGSYIVEFEDDVDPSHFYAAIGHAAAPSRTMSYSIFNGATMRFHSSELERVYATRLRSMTGIKTVYPLTSYDIPRPDVAWTAEPGRQYVAAPATSKRDNADIFSPHVMTGVDLLHQDGVYGDGIKIAVIDTGIDYTHPALGGCFGAGCLVSYGADLVGDAYNGTNTPVPDDDPMDCAGHGTHVAGIIAAQQAANPFGIVGAAPNATLGAFRVFGCEGQVQTDVMIAAFAEAYEAGSNIITASISAVNGWSEEPWTVVVQRIVEKGVPCTISAGNDGPMGMWFASGAGDGKGAASVASIDNAQTPSLLTVSNYSVGASQQVPFGWAAGSPGLWADVTLPLWAADFNTSATADGCDPFPSGTTPDLTGYIVLLRRGACSFTEKAANAAAHGARFVLFYNDVEGAGLADVSAVPQIIAAAMTTPEYGAALMAALKNGQTVVLQMGDPLSLPRQLSVASNSITAGAMSVFTTWGPTYEADLKPQFGAVGGSVLSTFALAKGGYAVLSGTSMATPLMAGIYALLMQVRGNSSSSSDPATLQSVLSATAQPVRWNDGTSWGDGLAPVAQQGGGLVQAYAAAHLNIITSVSSLSWNDTDNFEATKSFEIVNLGNSSISVTLGNVGAMTAYTYDGLDNGTTAAVVVIFPPPLVDAPATMTFDGGDTVAIPAGGKAIVNVTATPPAGLDPTRLPVWSGFLTLNGTDGSSLTLPYQGIGGSLHSQNPLGNAFLSDSRFATSAPTPAAGGSGGGNTTFLLPPRDDAAAAAAADQGNYVLPRIVANLVFGSPLVVLEITAVTIIGSSNSSSSAGGIRVETPLGQPAGFDGTLQPRKMITFDWDGKMAGNRSSGGYAPAGRYKVAVRALRIFGNKNGGASEWDVISTEDFRITYAG